MYIFFPEFLEFILYNAWIPHVGHPTIPSPIHQLIQVPPNCQTLLGT